MKDAIWLILYSLDFEYISIFVSIVLLLFNIQQKIK